MKRSLWLGGFGALCLCMVWACEGGGPVNEQTADGSSAVEYQLEKAGVESSPESGLPDGTVETGPEPQVEATPEPQPEPFVEFGPEPSIEVTPESQVESVPEAQPEPQVEAQPEPQPEPSVGKDYSQSGPMMVSAVPKTDVTLASSTGCSGGLCKVSLEISYPSGTAIQGPYPLAILSNGFQLTSDRYASYAKHLSSWGYVVIRWDTTGESLLSSLSHAALGKMIVALIGWADQQSQSGKAPLKGLIDTTKVYVLGHSRGGKASALAAQEDARITVFLGLDPVDSNPPLGGNRVSAVAGMSKTKAAIAVIGTDKSSGGFQPCAPTAENYTKFYEAAGAPAWEILIVNSGHMQFIDNKSTCGFTCSVCSNGSTTDAKVQELSRTIMVAWAEKYIRGADISSYLTGSWRTTLEQSNQIKVRTK